MPSRPTSHRLPGLRTRSEREATRKATYDATRERSADRGYDTAWRKTRAEFIKAHPMCSHANCGQPTREVDHVQTIASHPELRLDWANLRALCKRHHSQRTAREQGFAGGSAHPNWLRPSLVPLVIVCGPPASGKSAWVKQHAAPRDLVLDLDQIASEMAGSSFRAWDAKWIGPALRARNDMLGKLGTSRASWPRAWLIVSEPSRSGRQWWADTMKPQRIVVIETPPETCMERVRADPDRAVRRDTQYAAISGWWGRYERRPGDEVVRQ